MVTFENKNIYEFTRCNQYLIIKHTSKILTLVCQLNKITVSYSVLISPNQQNNSHNAAF